MDVLGIDIGGSAIKSAPVLTEIGRLATERWRIPTPTTATPQSIATAIDEICRHFDWDGPIGCGFPAVICNGVVRTAANIDPTWIGTDIAALLTLKTGLPARVINDADAAGLAEMRFGAGVGEQGTVLMVTAGTGLGTALFRNGVLTPNTELGHLQLKGQKAEHYASAAVKERLALPYAEWAQRFDSFLRHLEDLFWPDLFIIGGEICRRHEEFLPFLTVRTKVVPAALRNDAGIIGAALSAVGGSTCASSCEC